MATRYIHRGSALPPGQSGLPNANSIRVDSDDNIVKVGTGASGTTENSLVDTTSAQTLTNKTITAPVGTIASEIVTATRVLTAADSGKTIFLNSSTEFATTLPAPAQGLFFRFIVTAAPSGASYTVATDAAAQILAGQVFGSDGGDGDSETTATGTTITFVDGASVVGDTAEVISDGTSWFARCWTNVATTGITITG